jgi:CBS domain-containing protein
MRVADIMTRDVEFVDAEMTARDAAATMGDLGVGALPVGSPEDLQGIVTDRDILFRVVAAGQDGNEVRVGAIMSTLVFACREDDTIEAAMDLMGARNVRRLPVKDGEGRVVGWITLADLSRRLLLDSHVMQTALQELAEAPA